MERAIFPKVEMTRCHTGDGSGIHTCTSAQEDLPSTKSFASLTPTIHQFYDVEGQRSTRSWLLVAYLLHPLALHSSISMKCRCLTFEHEVVTTGGRTGR
jgi:hypothetical protein